MLLTNDTIRDINKLLDEYGDNAIQSYETVSGFEATGYRPQYIYDAVNTVLGVTGWSYTVHTITIDETELKDNRKTLVACAEVSVQFLDNGKVYYETGKQYGGSRVVSGGTADAKKGAVTDAIGKCLSVLSIGNKAYRGQLDKPSSSSKPSVTKFATSKPKFVARPKIAKPSVQTTQETTSASETPTTVVTPPTQTRTQVARPTPTVTKPIRRATVSATQPTPAPISAAVKPTFKPTSFKDK